MADTPLTEALARFWDTPHDERNGDEVLITDAARRWAELEALVADGGRVVVEGVLTRRDGSKSWTRSRVILGGDQ